MDGSDFFCDFMTVRQDHPPHRPLSAAVESRYDRDKDGFYPRPVSVSIASQCDASFQVMSDGRRVTWSGNPSRFARLESVRGLTVDESKAFINASLLALDLPPFSDGTFGAAIQGPASKSGADWIHDGAVVSRCDATTNIALGSPADRRNFLHARERVSPCRLKPSYNEGTLYYGYHSRERTLRLYDKAEELTAKAVKHVRKHSPQMEDYLRALVSDLDTQGTIRVELQAKRTLKRRGVEHWGQLTTESMAPIFREDFLTMTNDILDTDLPDFSRIPPAAVPALSMYLHGIDLKGYYARDAFRKYRRMLLPFNYDIAIRNTTPAPVTVRQFVLTVPVLPEEYIGPKPFNEDELAEVARALIKARRNG